MSKRMPMEHAIKMLEKELLYCKLAVINLKHWVKTGERPRYELEREESKVEDLVRAISMIKE